MQRSQWPATPCVVNIASIAYEVSDPKKTPGKRSQMPACCVLGFDWMTVSEKDTNTLLPMMKCCGTSRASSFEMSRCEGHLADLH